MKGRISARSVLLFMTAVLLSACITAVVVKKYPVGSIVTDRVIIDKREIPLPPGEWEVLVSRQITTRTGGTPMNAMVLAAVDRKSPIFGIELSASVDGALLGDFWRKPKGCTRTNIHFTYEDKTVKFPEHACWYINHTRMTRSEQTSKLRAAALDRAISRGVKLPITSIIARFGISDGLNFVSETVHFNPQLDGFEKPRNAAWLTNDWHKDLLFHDSKKIAYIQNIKKWGETWFPKMKAGFDGKLAATAGTVKTK